PAYVLNLRWDVVAWNAAADRYFGFAAREQPARNLLRLMFTAPDLRERLPAWEEDAPRLLACFRRDVAGTAPAPERLERVDALTALSPTCNQWWRQAAAQQPARGLTAFQTEAGRVDVRHEVLVVDENRHLRMTVYFSEDR